MPAAPADRTGSGGRRRAGYALCAHFGLLVGLVGPSVPSLRAAFDLDYQTAALHLTLFSIGALGGSSSADRLEQRLGRRAMLVAALLLMGAGAATVALAPVVLVSLAGCLVAGAAGVVVANAGNAVLGELETGGAASTIARAQALSALATVGAAALVAAVVLLPGPGAWRLAWLGPGVVAVLLVARGVPGRTATAVQGVDDGASATPSSTGDGATVVPVGDPRRRRLGAVLAGLGVAIEWAVTFWAAAYLTDVLGLADAAAAGATALAYVGLVGGRLVLVRVTRRHDVEPLLRLVLLGVLVAAVPYLAGPQLGGVGSMVAVFVALGLLCLLVGTLFPLALSLTMAAASPAEQSRASAGTLLGGSVAGIVAPWILGRIADATSLGVALLALPLLTGVALAVLRAIGPPPARAADAPDRVHRADRPSRTDAARH